MDDAHDIDERELAALADGTLAGPRRDELLRRHAGSAALGDQRAALTAIRATAGERAPERLRDAVAAMAAAAEPAPRRRARLPRWSLPVGGLTAALVAAAVLIFAGGEQAAAPSVSEAAARVALAPAPAHSPADRPVAEVLASPVEGLGYPYWGDATGWRAVRARRDDVGGRAITTVFYENARGQRVGYAIAAGAPLAVNGGRTVVRHGVRMRVLESGGATVVTWLRGGHTCILAARGVGAAVLTVLASR